VRPPLLTKSAPSRAASTWLILITPTDPMKTEGGFATLEQLADGRVDRMLGKRQHAHSLPWVGNSLEVDSTHVEAYVL